MICETVLDRFVCSSLREIKNNECYCSIAPEQRGDRLLFLSLSLSLCLLCSSRSSMQSSTWDKNTHPLAYTIIEIAMLGKRWRQLILLMFRIRNCITKRWQRRENLSWFFRPHLHSLSLFSFSYISALLNRQGSSVPGLKQQLWCRKQTSRSVAAFIVPKFCITDKGRSITSCCDWCRKSYSVSREVYRSLELICIWIRLIILYPVSVACSTLFPDRFHIRSGEDTVLAPFCTRAWTLNQIDFLSSAWDLFPLQHKQEEQIESSRKKRKNKRETLSMFASHSDCKGACVTRASPSFSFSYYFTRFT